MRRVLLRGMMDGLWPRARPALGTVASDRAVLAEAPALRHLAGALVGGRGLTAADLFRPGLEFQAPPEPLPWMLAQGRDNPPAEGHPLRLLCWNLALLDVHVFGRPYRQSPMLDARRPAIARALAEADADIVFLQELWHEADARRLGEALRAAGYQLVQPATRWRHGLAFLLREELAPRAGAPLCEPYAAQDLQEALWLPGKEPFLRSWLELRLDHPGLGPLRLLNAHLQAYPRAWRARMLQSRELGLRAASAPPEELVLVGGDLNAAPFYGRQSWRLPGGGFDSEWFHNALSLPLLWHHGGLSDLVLRGWDEERVRGALRLAREVENDPRTARQPLDPPSPAHAQAFSATDHNRLYHLQYAGTEQPARLDHLLARDPGGRVHVARSRHRFVERSVPSPGGPVEPSDHYAVELELRVAPPEPAGRLSR